MRARLTLPVLLWLLPGCAAAQPATEAGAELVVLSLGGDAPDETARRAREAVAAALQAEGTRVLPDAEVGMRISPARLDECATVACAHAIARELEVPMAATVTVWMNGEDLRSVHVGLVLGPGRSHSGSADVADGDLEAAAREAVRAARAAQQRSLVVEGPAVATEPEPEESEQTTAPASPLQAERSLEEWILPSLLGVVGLALVGMSVYALLEEQCDLRGPSGTCLRGSAPNVGVGVTFAITGSLAIAGAIIWLVIGGQPPEMGDIDVVLGPEGGGLSWRGRF